MRDDNKGYFEELPKGTQEIVKELILKAANDRNGPEGYKNDSDCFENIECYSRDGFIASRYNRGGLIYRNFVQLMDYYSGGYSVAHEKSNTEIIRLIDMGLKEAKENFIEANKEVLNKHSIIVEDYRSISDSKIPAINELVCNA